MTKRRIDMHAHLIPPGYLEAITPPTGEAPPLPPATREGLEAAMDRYGIDSAVVSTGPPGAVGPDQARVNAVARIANEEIAEVVHDAPERFAGLALLPLPDSEAALAELGHALDELGLDGVILFSNVGGVYLGDPILEPVFEELGRRGAYVFLHPGFPPSEPPLGDRYPVWLHEFTFETTRAVVNLIYSGTMERHPRLRLQLAHLGGAAPFLAHRIASLGDREPDQAATAPAGALEYLRRLYYDTGLSNHPPPLAATLEVTDLDHIVFGTDWPYAALPDGDDPAPDLGHLEPAERAPIEATNAIALVPRWGEP
jgi:predicted TIM-barrel fold metal-dependent hydrolase